MWGVNSEVEFAAKGSFLARSTFPEKVKTIRGEIAPAQLRISIHGDKTNIQHNSFFYLLNIFLCIGSPSLPGSRPALKGRVTDPRLSLPMDALLT